MKHARTSHVIRFLLLSVVSVGTCVCSVAADPESSGAGKPAPDLAAGAALYQQHCARCHGITAAGDGRDAARLYPKPRNFAEGVYKFRSTASGTPPTDDDLFQTITDGLPGSGMPDWRHLNETQRWQLVAYLKSLAPVFQENAPQPVPLGTDPGRRRADLHVGQQIYEKLGCAACHGASGRGDGPSAAALMDNWGRAIRPANLTQGWSYRGGSDPKAVVARVLTGIDGSPMPSYAEAASPEDVWQLAYYVRSLQREPRWSMIVHAAKVDGPLPESPADPRWAAAEPADVRMRNVVQPSGELAGAQSITVVSWQALYNADAISLRVLWYDPTEDRGEAGDALVVLFQPPAVAGDVVTLQTWPLRDSPPLNLLSWSAQRPEALEAIVRDYQPMVDGTASGAVRAVSAVYEQGQWVVVLARPLKPADLSGAAAIEPGRFEPVAFAVWDGGNPGQRAVSTWVDLMVQDAHQDARKEVAVPTRSRKLVWVMSVITALAGVVLEPAPQPPAAALGRAASRARREERGVLEDEYVSDEQRRAAPQIGPAPSMTARVAAAAGHLRRRSFLAYCCEYAGVVTPGIWPAGARNAVRARLRDGL